MSEISIRYQPFRLLPVHRTIKTTHPDDWKDLTPAQLIIAASVMNGTVKDDRVIQLMTNLKKKVIRRLSPYQKLSILELLRFLNTYAPYHEFILPKIGPLNRPQPRLKDETFGTFIFAETYLANYEKSFDKKDLDKFIACYYRSRKFREEDIEINAHMIRNEPEVQKQAIYINYVLIQQYLALNYPNIFKQAEESDENSKSSWVDVFDSVVGDDIVSQENYANLPISTVLRYLDKQIVKNRKNGK